MASNPSPHGVRNYNFKVVLLGEGCVGKTSLVIRFVEDKFSEKHISTLQASFLMKKLNVGGKRVNLAVWDTAGQERFHALGPIYYRDSNGAVLVYDITDEDSFTKVKNWVKELRKMLGPEVCLAIVGNKTDLEKQRVVPVQDAADYASSVSAKHYLTSAKLDSGVDDLFLDLTQRMVLEADKAGTFNCRATASTGARNRTSLQIAPNPEPGGQDATARSGCC